MIEELESMPKGYNVKVKAPGELFILLTLFLF